ncbi:MAG: 3-deoxy-8-phosphooctulonate synthase [Pseudomonadota bacterium]
MNVFHASEPEPGDLFSNRLRQKGAFFLIAGPCVIEDRETTVIIARTLKQITHELGIPFVFKASVDKANRTSVSGFRGPGFNLGLTILKEIKQDLDLLILSDIHLPDQAVSAAKVLDIIQIPAFLCRQTDLIEAAARTGRALNIKKGQFLAPWECANIITKARTFGCRDLAITERGTTFGYNNLVVDFRSIDIIRNLGVPVIFDATHSVQLPGKAGDSSAGERHFAPLLARAAVAAGTDGIFVETHPDPDRALCDGPNSIPLDQMKDFLSSLLAIRKAMVRP